MMTHAEKLKKKAEIVGRLTPLLAAVSDAQFDCGEHQGGGEDYDEAYATSVEAGKRLLDQLDVELEALLGPSESEAMPKSTIEVDLNDWNALSMELGAYRSGGVTEEILRRGDGYVKIGKGCVVVRLDDWEQLHRQVTELQANGTELVNQKRALEGKIKRLEERICNLRRGNTGQEKQWLQTKLGLLAKIEQLQAKLDKRTPNFGHGAKLTEVANAGRASGASAGRDCLSGVDEEAGAEAR